MTDTLRDLARAKATFQARALEAVLTEQPKGKTMKDEAPERIWVKSHHGESRCGYWEDKPIRPNSPKNQGTEYIRADLAPSPAPDVQELQKENVRLREALSDMQQCDEWAIFSHDEVKDRALAALATQEDREDG